MVNLFAIDLLPSLLIIALVPNVVTPVLPYSISAAQSVQCYAICGIGISNMVPIALSIGGSIPSINPSVALSIATTKGYSGVLVVPSLIGFVAKHVDFGHRFGRRRLQLAFVGRR